MNEFVKFQGCSSIHMGMAKDLDVPDLRCRMKLCIVFDIGEGIEDFITFQLSQRGLHL